MVAFYPSATEGFWGPGTSLTDWCEENYAMTPYLAEFWNTLSNIFFLMTAILGMRTLQSVGDVEQRNYLAFGSLLVVMTGSVLFHGTMWYHAQMLDEIPMIFNGCIIIYCALRIFPNSKKNDAAITTVLSLYSLLFTPIYVYNRNPDFFGFSHALLVVGLIFLPPIQINRLKREYSNIYDAKRIRGLWHLYWYSLACYLGGFSIWSYENVYCEHVRSVREVVGTPWSVLLELHMWWHLLSALGSYGVIILLAYMRLLAIKRTDVQLRWVGGTCVPILHSRLTAQKMREEVRLKKE
ncbi:hypothetical protein HDU80_005076 [Chytriomyces hyalinus]|nr:hypothetical protein HDU80_005076 [Chytriomyces hyalinus]